MLQGSSSLSVGFIDMADRSQKAEKPEKYGFVPLVKWI